MPPKKEVVAGEALLSGFLDKETKLLAAAFLSSTAPDKFDYDIMATLTGNTAGSLKKMCKYYQTGPPVKKKALEAHPSFAAYLGQAGVAAPASAGGDSKPAAASKVTKKRKAASEVPEEDAEDGAKDLAPASAADKSEAEKSDSKKKAPPAKKEKKGPTKKRIPVKGPNAPKKAAKKEPASEEEVVKDKSTEDSADGGDGLGEYSYLKNLETWLNNTDSELGDEIADDI
ncbi:hypothetical protein J4E85_004993 [Alternaria conjuncta]|uniref:uncharacterized protein n=1 Tax=Alternaria conjuncta TaxID=181017 RepID=UPI0022204C2B|nr:uncharacterized protein J4E85_004993 [Alternaria conjuncta]KAI4930366.1 hypothetical protein J4E85_004993 [Alternaria conjuncta]